MDYRHLAELLKVVYVTVAEEEFGLPGRNQTDSRISLLTGVHRKDVKVLRGSRLEELKLSEQSSLVANLVAVWLGTPELLDANNSPIAIPRLPSPGSPHSFAATVTKLTRDIPAKVLLDECIEQGVLALDNDDMVHLKVEAMVPVKDIDEKMYFFAQSIADHIAAAGENVFVSKPPFLDRYVWYVDLPKTEVDRVAVVAEKAAMRALKEVNQVAQECKKRVVEAGVKGSVRLHFGTFYYSASQREESESLRPSARLEV